MPVIHDGPQLFYVTQTRILIAAEGYENGKTDKLRDSGE